MRGGSKSLAPDTLGPETFSLRFALTAALAKRLYIEPSVTMGLSGPGQSFTFGVTLPYSF